MEVAGRQDTGRAEAAERVIASIRPETAMLAKFIDRPREDSLTAAVFGYLMHLTSEDFWEILRNACASSAFPRYWGEPRRVHAWPSWSAEGTRNSNRVIPDLVIEFDDFDLIIEAKRWDIPMQDEEQWKAELKAYSTEYGSRKRQVKMIALGGVHSHEDRNLIETWTSSGAPTVDFHQFICPVHMIRWSSLLLECRRWKGKLEKMVEPSSRTRSEIRILSDLIHMFIHHDFTPLRWFEDFDFRSNFLTESSESELDHFRNLSRRLKLA